MKVSKNFVYVVFTYLSLVILLLNACGRQVPEASEVSLNSEVIKKSVGGIPIAETLFRTENNWYLAYSIGKKFVVGIRKKNDWYWKNITDEVGFVRSWSGVICGGQLNFVVEKKDNRIYLLKMGGENISNIEIDSARFSSMGVDSSVVCDKSGNYHIALYDPLLGVLFYYEGQKNFRRKKIVESGESGLYPIIRITDFGRVYIAYLDADTGYIWVAHKDPGGKWVEENTGVKGNSFSFEIKPAEGGDLSQIYPRIVAVDPSGKGLWYSEHITGGWNTRYIQTNGYATSPFLFVSPLQEGIIFQNGYWQDLMIAGYDGYNWNIGIIDSEGATGYKPSVVVYGNKLFVTYYSISKDSILLAEVSLPWQ